MKAVFLDWRALDHDDLDASPLEVAVEAFERFDTSSRTETLARVADADILISNKVGIDGDVLDAATRAQLVCVAATGTNNVDCTEARRRGIRVCNVRAYGTASVVQHVFGLMIALHNRMLDYCDAVRRGDWQRSTQFCLLDYPITELAGKTLGIVGYGELGQAVARVARAFDMDVLVAQRDANDTRTGRLPLDELLARVDVLSLHCPLTEANRHLLDARALARMKPSAYVINTARGGLVDERALLDALIDGRIAGAAVDVLSVEPPRDEALLLAPLPNLIVTPHVAWASREARQRIVTQVAENIAAFRQGSPIRLVE